MNEKFLKTFAEYKHNIIVWLVGGFIALLITGILIQKTYVLVFPDEAGGGNPDVPEATTTLPNGCVQMPDGIQVCDTKAPARDAPELPAQVSLDGESGNISRVEFERVCGLFSLPRFTNAHRLRRPKPEATKALNWMVQQVGLSSNFKILAADFTDSSSAFAALRGKERFIVYDVKKYFLSPEKMLDWNSLGILGHELGHHLAGHTVVNSQAPHTRELEADKFTGFILSRLGATQKQAMSWAQDLDISGGLTHPPRKKRLQAAKDGWLQAENTQQIVCKTDWVGKEFELEYQTCRLARQCLNGQSSPRLACMGEADEWHWVR